MIALTDRLIERLKNTNVHTPRIAIVRFLLALGLLLTLLANDVNVIANHNYKKLPGYSTHYSNQSSSCLKKVDIFTVMAPEKARIIVAIMLILVMTGLAPQITGFLFFWACFSFHNYYIILNGGDDIAMVLSLLLLPVCITDPRFNQWKRVKNRPSKRNIIAGIAMFAIQLQAAWLYFDACIPKLWLKEWRDGTAVYYFTSHYRLGAHGWLQQFNEIFTLSPFVRLITWSVLLLELLLSMCIFFPVKTRQKFLYPAIFFHFLIVINFGLLSFFFSISALLILYLYNDKRSAISL